MQILPSRKYSVLIHFRLSLNKKNAPQSIMCADSFPVNQFMSASDCSHSSLHPWPLIIWSGYFRKLLCTCFLFLATRDSVDMQRIQLRRRCLVQYLQSMLVVTFSEVLLARSVQKNPQQNSCKQTNNNKLPAVN